MRGKKAKILRKLLYKDKDFRNRRYYTNKNKVTYNVADAVQIGNTKIGLRRLYRHLKKKANKLEIKDIKKILV